MAPTEPPFFQPCALSAPLGAITPAQAAIQTPRIRRALRTVPPGHRTSAPRLFHTLRRRLDGLAPAFGLASVTGHPGWDHPTFATKGGGIELFERAVRTVRDFRHRYRERLLRWRAGDRLSPWPAGTFMMLELHAVAVEPAPT